MALVSDGFKSFLGGGNLGKSYRPMFIVRPSGGQRHHDRRAAVGSRDGRLGVLRDRLHESPQLAAEAIEIAIHEEVQRQVTVDRLGGADDGAVRITVFSRDGALAAEDLDALIVSVWRFAAVVDGPDGAIGEAEHDYGRVDVAGGSDLRIHADSGGREDLGDLGADQEAGHVEVVDGHVEKHAAGDLDVGNGRRAGVAADDMEEMRRADLAARDGAADALEIGVEAAVEADLEFDAGLVDGGDLFIQSPLPTAEAIWGSIPAHARAELLARRIRVTALDTAELARRHSPRPDLQIRMQGVALVGVFLRVAPFAARAGLDREHLLEAVGKRLGRFFGKRGASVVEANLAVIAEAWDGLIDVTAAISAPPEPTFTREPVGVLS